MTKLFRLTLAVALLMLLAIGVDAGFDSLSSDFAPRGVRAFGWIVDHFADRPFGLTGVAFWLLVAAGSALLWGAAAFAGRPRAIKRDARPDPRPLAATGGATARRRQLGRDPAATDAEPVPDAEPIDFTALFNLDRKPEPAPAWRLVETAPELASSWIGGAPVAAQPFAWPASAEGRPMLFVAQVDASAVTGQGLPADAVLLFFIDAGWEFEVRTIAQADVAAGEPIPPPPPAVTPREVGWFQNEGATLRPTPVRLEPYHDSDSDTPVSKLLGVEVGDPHGFHYPEGFRNLLYIEHGERFATDTEHWQGMSFACPAAEIGRAVLTGRIFGTHNG